MATITEYQYTESGLDNVFISGLSVEDDAGDEYVVIPAVGQLHQLIAAVLVEQPQPFRDQEIYFLRAEMGMSIAEVNRLLHVKPSVDDLVALFKDTAIEQDFRTLVREQLSLKQVSHKLHPLSQGSVHIQATANKGYRLAAA